MSESVLVVGGGLIGALVALRLAESGLSVRVLERGQPGAEASSAAAGILAAQVEASAPGPGLELGLAGRALHATLHQELIELTGGGSGYRKNGTLEPTTDADHQTRLAACAWQQSRELSVESLDDASLRAVAPGLNARYTGGLFFADDATVDPPRLMASVIEAASRRGVRFEHGATVLEVTTGGGRVDGVRTDQGTRGAEVVVLCAGAWSGQVDGALDDPQEIRPARGQLVELAVNPVPFDPVLYAGGGYLLPRSDGRVCVGSTLEMVGFERGTTAAGLRTLLERAIDAVPSLGSAHVTRSWSSFRPRTPDGLPFVGELGVPGLFVAAGHHRSGILLAPITAEIVRDLIVHDRRHPHLDALRPDRFRGQRAG
jgi:glycine oxidase